jgi:hypothetical protein
MILFIRVIVISLCLSALERISFRFVTHLRTANYVSSSDSYAILKIDDCIGKIKHATFVCKFDLLKGCW